MSERYILLVEDNPDDEALTLHAVRKNNIQSEIVVARDGVEALNYLFRREEFETRTDGDPILILLDLKMPKVGGLEVLKILKADEGLKAIPVVVLSSSREAPDLDEAYKYGVNAYVAKPVDFFELIKAVKELGRNVRKVFARAMNFAEPRSLEL